MHQSHLRKLQLLWLLTKREVKMTGYWPRSFYGPKRSHTDQRRLVNKGFIIWKKITIVLRDTTGNPELASKRATPSCTLGKPITAQSVFGSFFRLTGSNIVNILTHILKSKRNIDRSFQLTAHQGYPLISREYYKNNPVSVVFRIVCGERTEAWTQDPSASGQTSTGTGHSAGVVCDKISFINDNNTYKM